MPPEAAETKNRLQGTGDLVGFWGDSGGTLREPPGIFAAGGQGGGQRFGPFEVDMPEIPGGGPGGPRGLGGGHFPSIGFYTAARAGRRIQLLQQVTINNTCGGAGMGRGYVSGWV